MELFDTTQVALERAMSGSAMRHQAIASNLANVNTPGYRRKDVDFQTVLAQTLGTGRDPHAAQFVVREDPSAPVRADGGSVDADAEGAAMARNAMEQQAIASVMKARQDIIKSAIGVA